MKLMNKQEAIAKALAAGGSLESIERQAENYVRQVGSVPFKNMIVALHFSPWRNGVAEWERLAAALMARGMARKRLAA